MTSKPRSLTRVLIGIILLLTLSCDEHKEEITPQLPMVCVYRINPTCVQATGCGPYKTFVQCDLERNALKWDISKYVVDKLCNRCG